ncbi:MAG: PLP-dependent aspartate aminotransferase family protein [Trueperaceae bacterium]|jgi:methionine-gamma-lyase|nr:PLP-dependent aspartate aminotransferase family protein [Truepera sp.]HRN18069.1 PLP-dependent aspartate aminotransferase family protein [Trueperaceae bacterium]HRQ10320.1 PLP-dependent aspartate aminotransferase family protein [Trueperaceae bacterium]
MNDNGTGRGFATRAVRAGQHADPLTKAHATPIYQTSTFVLGDMARGAAIFAGEAEGNVYSRIGNPTVRAVEEKVAALEGAEEGVAFASGMGAISAAFLSLLKQGDEVLLLGPLYGGTRGMLTDLLPRFGVTSRAVDDAELEAAVGPNTRMIYVESPTNPDLRVHDLSLVGRVAATHGLISVADNTFATPYLTRPIEHGIDIVVHSATKYLGGHGDLLGGVMVGPAELLHEVRMEGLRHLGAALDPQAAYLLLRGMRTLHLRMEAHCSNARAVAEALRGRPGVSRVHYPGFEDHPGHAVAAGQMSDFGGMVSLELEGGLPAAAAFLESLRLFDHAVSLGDVASLACHPASTTHQLLPQELLAAEGVTDGLVRLSVGIEAAEDLVADVLRAATVAAGVAVPG